METFHESSFKILSVLQKSSLSFSEIVENSGLSRRTVNKLLKSLVAEELVEKKRTDEFPFVCIYSLSEKGRRLLARVTPIEEVVRGLHRFGSALLLQERSGFIDGLTVVKPMKILARSFLLLGDVEKEWLRFLANIYVAAPLKIFGRKPDGLIELRCCWQLVRPDGWRIPDRRIENGHECFVFDFPTVYNTLCSTLSEWVKARMAEKKVEWSKVVFHELRAFSFPLQERWRLSKEGKLTSS
jgi:DNA-binding HxlR family transcriptional regulator